MFKKLAAFSLAVVSALGVFVSGVGFQETTVLAADSHKLVNGDFGYLPYNNVVNVAGAVPAKLGVYIEPNGRFYLTNNFNRKFSMGWWSPSAFGWKSTQEYIADDGSVDHRSVAAGTVQINYDTNSHNPYAELTIHTKSTIYQDVETIPDSVYKWRLKHAAHDNTRPDTMQVLIGPPGRESPVQAYRETSNGHGLAVGLWSSSITTYSTNGKGNEQKLENQWETYSGVYEVPIGQTKTRFSFKAIDGRPTYNGNNLDDIDFDVTYAVNFDMNGGYGAEFNPKSGNYNGYRHAGTRNNPAGINGKTPIRSGYKFMGWATEPLTFNDVNSYVANRNKIITEDGFIMPANHKTFYAAWGRNPTVYWYSNGQLYHYQTTEFGGTVSAPGNPSLNGYTFNKWNTSFSGNIYSDIVVSAEFTPNLYTTWYYKNNPSGASVGDWNISLNRTSQQARYGSQWGTLATASKPGYTFQGWYNSPSGGSRYAATNTVTGNRSAYAHWSANPYTIYFDKTNPPGASASASNIALNRVSQIGYFDSTWGTLATASKNGYIFNGWYDSSSGGSPVTANTRVDGDRVVYARWTPMTYTLTYVPNNPAGASANDIWMSKTSQTAKFDSVWGSMATASKTGYIFQGWYTVGGQRVTENTLVQGDLKVYAHWTPIKYRIRFHGNQENRPGQVTGTMGSMEFTYDKLQALPVNLYKKTVQIPGEDESGELIAKPSTFLGWGLSPTALVSGYKDQAQIMNLTSRNGDVLDFYAIWDDTPEFVIEEFPNRYFTLDEAKNGVITEDELLSTVKVYDRETNELPKKTSAQAFVSGDEGITLVDYDANEFQSLDDDAIISVRYQVKDGREHTAYLYIKVYVSENGPRSEEQVSYYRSISDEYYQGGSVQGVDGGLTDHSVWRSDEGYKEKLENSLRDGGLLEYSLRLNQGELSRIKEYVNEHGFGNAENPDALSSLFDSLR